MEIRSFTIGEALKVGWTKFKEHPFTWVGTMLLIGLIWAMHSALNSWLMGKGYFWGMDAPQLSLHSYDRWNFILTILFLLLQCGLNLGVMAMGLRAVDGLNINIFHLFSQFRSVFRYLGASILYGLMIVIGLLLFIIPGAIWGAKYALYPYFIIDRNASAFEAIHLSGKATHGHKWDIFAFIMITNLLVMITFFIGLLIFAPIIAIAWAFIYRKLTSVFEPAVLKPNPPIVDTSKT